MKAMLPEALSAAHMMGNVDGKSGIKQLPCGMYLEKISWKEIEFPLLHRSEEC